MTNSLEDSKVTFQAMFKAMFHHNEELLKRCVVRVQRPAQIKRWFNQPLDTQFRHIHQVHAFISHEIVRIYKEKMKKKTWWVTKAIFNTIRYPSLSLSFSLIFEDVFRSSHSFMWGTLQAFGWEKSKLTSILWPKPQWHKNRSYITLRVSQYFK